MPFCELSGVPKGIALSSDDNLYIADQGHQTILLKKLEEKTDDVVQMIKDFEGEPFLGPNYLVLRKNNSELFFTDSGPLTNSSISTPNVL